jgi:hypothetical protein
MPRIWGRKVIEVKKYERFGRYREGEVVVFRVDLDRKG